MKHREHAANAVNIADKLTYSGGRRQGWCW